MGDGYAEQPLTKLSTTSTKKWADRIGAEYQQYTGPRNYKGMTAEKLNVFQEQYDEYDYVLVLDADIIVTDVAPDIFSLYQFPISGMPCSGKSVGHGVAFGDRPSGATLMYDRHSRQEIREWLKSYKVGTNHCADEDAILNASRALHIPMICRAQEWDNYPPREGGVRKDFYLIHFVGNCRKEYFKLEDWT